jgi:translation initiation factor 1
LEKNGTRIVYSTDFGTACPECGKPKNDCVCRKLKKEALPKARGAVRIRYETAGRKGKGVTLISGLPLSRERLSDLARKLKQSLGTGGAVKDFTIELQGDQREKLMPILRKEGYPV